MASLNTELLRAGFGIGIRGPIYRGKAATKDILINISKRTTMSTNETSPYLEWPREMGLHALRRTESAGW